MKADLQKTFDKVARHLLTQKQKSGIGNIDENFACMYRGPDGLKCAVGCLIPDEMYSLSMERRRVEDLLMYFPELRTVPDINSFDYALGQLQIIHDIRAVSEWPKHLRLFAASNDLNDDVLKEFV